MVRSVRVPRGGPGPPGVGAPSQVVLSSFSVCSLRWWVTERAAATAFAPRPAAATGPCPSTRLSEPAAAVPGRGPREHRHRHDRHCERARPPGAVPSPPWTGLRHARGLGGSQHTAAPGGGRGRSRAPFGDLVGPPRLGKSEGREAGHTLHTSPALRLGETLRFRFLRPWERRPTGGGCLSHRRPGLNRRKSFIF